MLAAIIAITLTIISKNCLLENCLFMTNLLSTYDVWVSITGALDYIRAMLKTIIPTIPARIAKSCLFMVVSFLRLWHETFLMTAFRR